jgi:hypothetical protein
MKPTDARDIPDSILEQMKEFRTHLRQAKLWELLCILGIIPLASIILFLISDRFWDTPAVIRWLLILPTILSWIILPIWVWYRWFYLKQTPRQLGKYLSLFDQSLGDQILSLFDLDVSSASRNNFTATSPALRRAAMAQLAEELKGRNFREVLPPSQLRLGIKILLSLLGVIALASLIIPHACGNTFLRWLNPCSERERFTFVRVNPLPKQMVVAKGESMDLLVSLQADSQILPDQASYHLKSQTQRTISRQDSSFVVTIPALSKEDTLQLRIGDYTHKMRLIPRSRPELDSASAEVTLPAYLNRPSSNEPMRGGTISVPEGSEISLTTISTRELAKAKITPDNLQPKIVGKTMVLDPIVVGKDTLEWSVVWTDVDGLSSSQPVHISVVPYPDKKPEVAVRGNSNNKYILADTAIPLEVEASDDFGIAEVGIAWSGESSLQQQAQGEPSQNANSQHGEISIHKGHSTETSCHDTYVFRASDLGISPQRVVLQAYAKDFYPDRSPVYSEPLVLHILSPENHAEMIRHSIDRLSGSLEELSRSLDSMEDEIKALSQQNAEELRQASVSDKLHRLEQDEITQRRNLQDLIEQGEAIFTEATRNHQIDPEGMKKFMSSLQLLEALPSGSLKLAQQMLGQAASQELDATQRQQSLSQADQAHSNSASQVRNAIANLSKATKDMEAGTFVARLGHLSGMELSIAKSLVDPLQASPGLNLGELPPSDKRNLDTILALQKSTTKDMRWLVEDLGNYKSRNSNPIYSDLYQQMSDADPAKKMEKIQELVSQALPGMAMEHAHRLSLLLDNWSKLLEEEKKKAPEGGGGEGGDASPEEIPQSVFELMLKLMRMIQQQQDIRMRTRAEEQLFRKEVNA